MFYIIIRYDGTKLKSNTVSRQIANLCSDYFGVYLNITSLRAINNTAVKNAAAHGDLNDTQLDEYNIECQGHTTRMGKKAYNFSREPDRAKTLQKINDMINKKYKSDVCNNNIGSCDDDGEMEAYTIEDINADACRIKRKRDENDSREEELHTSMKKKKLSTDEELIEKHKGEWGKQHPCYDKVSLKIKWSPFEKEYLQAIYDVQRHSKKRNVWRHCLDSILNTNDENVRQQFHISHLMLVKLKDAIRVRKEDCME